MEIRNLESFIQAAELGSFTRAAEKLGVYPVLYLLRIRQLEDELGTQLFERINHTVKLTSSGREMLELAQQIVRTAEEMKRKADSRRRSAAVRIAMAESLSYTLSRGFYPFSQPFSSSFLLP